MVNEVAVLVTGEPCSPRDIVLRAHDNTLQRIADTHKFYDALQYPLIFSKGEPVYHFNIPVVNPTTEQPVPNKKVSCMDFYVYCMMLREHDFNLLLRTRQFFHQFLVDIYIKVESERLRYIALNQKKLRAENYIHLQDAISADDNIRPNHIDKIVILPSTFVNSPRYLQEYTQDAFTYVRTYGRPDLFVTFTCNPSWQDVTQELMSGQKATNQHDIVARVFRLKLKHKLLPNQIDNRISTEIPDPEEDKNMYYTVIKNMIRGPCEARNPASPCMQNGKCTKKYPRELIREIVHSDNGLPVI
ncbi:hypothetical protein TNCV_2815021 [Trichonephila clavipes]|nr:hypothetical protein TNCV_2815021 [Trichonephila clavipes]